METERPRRRLCEFVLISLFGMMLITTVSQADGFRWIDSHGQVHYGDQPPESAIETRVVDLGECKTDQCLEQQELRRLQSVERLKEIEAYNMRRETSRRIDSVKETAKDLVESSTRIDGTSLGRPRLP